MSKVNVYEQVTDRVVALLEQGTVPWRKPWTNGMPQNIEGRKYRGINAFLLGVSGHTTPFWMTFNQAKERNGTVKKGEHGTMIVFWKRLKVTEKNEDTGKMEQKVVPMLRYYYVFNLDQTENVKVPKRVTEWLEGHTFDHEPLAEAEAIVAGYENGPSISEDGDAAYYVPALDAITVPPRSSFKELDEFYGTLFHELGHSTGHESRLHRDQKHGFGTHDYGREELVAEMTAAFLAAECGIETTTENTAAYLASWVKTIREDTKAVVVAAGQAQRAADLILGVVFSDEAGKPVESSEPVKALVA